jgi:hypothetical protein
MAQNNLKEMLGKEPIRPRLVADCTNLIDAQVRAKGGLSGVAIKGAYATIKRIKKGIVPEVVNGLLDEWLDKLQVYHDTWRAGGGGVFSEFLAARAEDVAEDMLSVTDARAERSSHTTARKAYKKMRGSAKHHVMEAVPDLARILERHLQAAETPESES